MKLWNYIGEFFLFRWLFGKRYRFKRENDEPINGRSNLIGEDLRNHIVNDSDNTDTIHGTIPTVCDYDNDDDDLDIFMRNNRVREYSNQPLSTGNFGNNHYWNSGNYNQSFGDFHEEQDNYDMMDDF